MNATDHLALERFQLSVPGATERKVNELADIVCELVELAKTRDGSRTLRTKHERLKEPMKKLYELYCDFQPALKQGRVA